MPRIVDEDVQPAELCDGVIDGPARRLLVGQVARQQNAPPARLLNPCCDIVRIALFLREIADGHVAAFAREGDCDGPADTRVTARDQRRAPLQPVAPRPGLLAMVRNRRHVGRETRRLLLLFGEASVPCRLVLCCLLGPMRCVRVHVPPLPSGAASDTHGQWAFCRRSPVWMSQRWPCGDGLLLTRCQHVC